MKTKTILLAAVLSLAGASLAKAQPVFSDNAVGYVNTSLVPGLNLISNPLQGPAGKNTIASLFTEAARSSGAAIQVYKFIPGPNPTYKIFTWDNDFQEWDRADAATETTEPGGGVFVRNPKSTPIVVLFPGEVRQGALTTQLPVGLSIISSQVPIAGPLDQIGYTPAPGDQIYQFLPSQTYYISSWDAEFQEFDRPLQPLKVGEAIFIRRQSAGSWVRNFSVNE